MRGSIELSLNALIMFILSVMVLGAGIYLVGFVLDIGANVINSAPDRCRNALDLQSDNFALCPTRLPDEGVFRERESYEVAYAFYNVADNLHTEFAVGIISNPANPPKFQIQPSYLSDVDAKESRRGVLLIDAVSGATLSDTEYVKVFICPDSTPGNPSGTPDCDSTSATYGTNTDPEIFRTLTINVR